MSVVGDSGRDSCAPGDCTLQTRRMAPTVAATRVARHVRPGSRIRVLTAVMTTGVSKPRANAKVLSLFRLAVLGSQISRENSRNSTAARSVAHGIRADRSESAPRHPRADRGRAVGRTGNAPGRKPQRDITDPDWV